LRYPPKASGGLAVSQLLEFFSGCGQPGVFEVGERSLSSPFVLQKLVVLFLELNLELELLNAVSDSTVSHLFRSELGS